jgi:hypothetical protein
MSYPISSQYYEPQKFSAPCSLLLSMITVLTVASSANAQKQTPATEKTYSVGPAVEFNGSGTSFGIKGKIGVPGSLSFRPIVLFGYTPNVSSANFSQAVSSGSGTLNSFSALTTEQKRAQVKLIYDVALTDQQADVVASNLSAALSTPINSRTTDQNFLIFKSQDSVRRYDIENFKTLTPAQQRSQVSIFALPGTNIDAATAALKQAVETPIANRSPAQLQTITDANTRLQTADLSMFSSLNAAQQREELQIFSKAPLTDAQADTVANRLTSALDITNILQNPTNNLALARNTPEALRTPEYNLIIALNTAAANQTATQIQLINTAIASASLNAQTISNANQAVAYTANTQAVGFTPGTGTAYGAAVTLDFESSDKKLSGYIGPRVLVASGSSKVGNFDTNTNETNVGILVGADYAISPDFTAGLSGTYNFSKSGTLDVSGPGGFRGSSTTSGSSFDIGINLGYRF